MNAATLGSSQTPEVERYWASRGICIVRQKKESASLGLMSDLLGEKRVLKYVMTILMGGGRRTRGLAPRASARGP